MAGKRANATSYGGKQGNTPKGKDQKRPGTGRLPDVFKARMALLASRQKTVKNVEKILDNPNHPLFGKMLDFAAERGFGKESTPVDATVTVKVIREENPPSV